MKLSLPLTPFFMPLISFCSLSLSRFLYLFCLLTVYFLTLLIPSFSRRLCAAPLMEVAVLLCVHLIQQQQHYLNRATGATITDGNISPVLPFFLLLVQ